MDSVEEFERHNSPSGQRRSLAALSHGRRGTIKCASGQHGRRALATDTVAAGR